MIIVSHMETSAIIIISRYDDPDGSEKLKGSRTRPSPALILRAFTWTCGCRRDVMARLLSRFMQ